VAIKSSTAPRDFRLKSGVGDLHSDATFTRDHTAFISLLIQFSFHFILFSSRHGREALREKKYFTITKPEEGNIFLLLKCDAYKERLRKNLNIETKSS
jgi:hypothetical protein